MVDIQCNQMSMIVPVHTMVEVVSGTARAQHDHTRTIAAANARRQ